MHTASESASQPRTPGFAKHFAEIKSTEGWIKWLAIVALILVILVIAFFLGYVAIGMYLVIVGLAIHVIGQGYLDAKTLNRETRLASRQADILEEVDDFEAFFSQAEPSRFRNHVEHLYMISWVHPEVSQDNLLEVLHNRLLARNRMVEVLASVLVTLGLIGTIVGLILMMESLKTKIVSGAGQGSETLMISLFGDAGPLQGLGTAFITTLLGAVLGGVVMRILTSVMEVNIMHYTAHLAELTEIHVLPALRQMSRQRERNGDYDRLEVGVKGESQ